VTAVAIFLAAAVGVLLFRLTRKSGVNGDPAAGRRPSSAGFRVLVIIGVGLALGRQLPQREPLEARRGSPLIFIGKGCWREGGGNSDGTHKPRRDPQSGLLQLGRPSGTVDPLRRSGPERGPSREGRRCPASPPPNGAPLWRRPRWP